MKKTSLEISGLVLLVFAVTFFYFALEPLSKGDHFSGLLEIFVGFSLIRAGLELTKLSVIDRRESD